MMKSRSQESGSRRGFTLVEVLLAVSISVLVFFAMGMLLSKCFSLWKDATANWRLAQYARISRERILCGGFNDPAEGLLSATNVTLDVDGGYDFLEYVTVAGYGVVQRVYGYAGSADNENLYLKRGSSQWAFGQTVANYSFSYNTPVKIDLFTASITNDIVTISYRVKFSAGGKTFTQPHTISAQLVNKE